MKGKCSHCSDPHKRSECKKLKEVLALAKQGNCKWCNMAGHLENTCFVKYPDKKPSWLKLISSKTKETSTSNLEDTSLSMDQDF